MYYILAEDFCAALIGPFDSYSKAEQHIGYCKARGDSAKMDVITHDHAKDLWSEQKVHLKMTEAQDRCVYVYGAS